MAIICPNCGAEFDATLFEFGYRVRCDCGTQVAYPGADLREGHAITQGDAASTARSVPSGEFGERLYQVWRQGDDGNSFLVQQGLTDEEADEMVAEFESRGHKQLYWKSRADSD